MPGPDRRHSAAVARRVDAALDEDAPRTVLAAALLHDVGKTSVGLRTPGRVVATLTAMMVGQERAAGFDSAIGRYLRHDELGAELAERAGSDPLTVAGPASTTCPARAVDGAPALRRRLQAADDD